MPRRVFSASVIAAALLAGACSSDAPVPASNSSAPPPAATKGKPAARSRTSAPAVRLFAGVDSIVGSLGQFCRGTKCDAPGAAARRLEVDAGSVITFAVDAKPDLAVLDVSGAGARRVTLPSGTLMPLQGGLAPGSHRLTLQLRWGTSVGTWLFDLVVRRD